MSGLLVIGTFIKCAVYNKAEEPTCEVADDSWCLRTAVNHPADRLDDCKSC